MAIGFWGCCGAPFEVLFIRVGLLRCRRDNHLVRCLISARVTDGDARSPGLPINAGWNSPAAGNPLQPAAAGYRRGFFSQSLLPDCRDPAGDTRPDPPGLRDPS